MKFKMFLLVWTISWLSTVQHATAFNEALLECGRVLHIENITNLSNATASYSNSRCMLVCVIGSGILPVSSIHEGRSCPEDTNGICRAGQCISGQEDALRECGLKHGVDFHKVGNYQGTAHTNDQCALRCVLGGIELPVSHLHEGSPCPANPINGVCRSGTCVAQSTNPVSTVTSPLTTITPKPPTTPIPPTTVTQPDPLDSFSPSKMKLLNISLESTDPTPLHHMAILDLGFYVTSDLGQSNRIVICTFYGDSTHPNWCNLQNIHNIPSKITKTSIIRISLNQLDTWTSVYINLYPVFDTFYENRKLDFGKEEHFVATFPINQISYPKVKNISLRFTIVFSKD